MNRTWTNDTSRSLFGVDKVDRHKMRSLSMPGVPRLILITFTKSCRF